MIIEMRSDWPDKRLAPNRSNGRFWGAAAKLKAETRAKYREVAGEYKEAVANNYSGGNVSLTIAFYEPNKRKRDMDGMLSSLKPTLDGMADGLGLDDYCFGPITLVRAVDEAKIGYVTFTFNFGE